MNIQLKERVKKMVIIFKHEFFEMLPPTIFFFIAFSLLVATQKLILHEYDIPFHGISMAIIGALLVGKVVLITDHFSFVNKFPDKPLLYNVVWKTIIYFIAALIVRYLEHILPLWKKYEDFVVANQILRDETVWAHFWLIMMWISVLFFIYCAMRELVRVIGKEQVKQMFLGSKQS
ncbi:hypothetical protein DOJK_01632 [Patescibacteria group bacterium]|nr:hypothetical protein DOJK_01632 [Patescibacteria group bacterium]